MTYASRRLLTLGVIIAVVAIILGLIIYKWEDIRGVFFQREQEAESTEPVPVPEEITLTYFGLWDDKDILEPFIESFEKDHPQITIEYKKLSWDDYEDQFIDNISSDDLPDIFVIRGDSLAKYEDYISSCPDSVMSSDDFKNTFVEVAYNDLVSEDQIYGIPLSVDSLALYYNKDLFEEAELDLPPETWDEVKDYAQELTEKDEDGTITQAGIALGTSKNIGWPSDILQAMMLQKEISMVDQEKNAIFNLCSSELDEVSCPGAETLELYTSFIDPESEWQSWDNDLSRNTEMFVQGKLAMMINYSFQVSQIKSQNPDLDFAVAPLPRVEKGKNITYARYWVLAVSKKSEHPEQAWDFIKFLSSKESNKEYCANTSNPTSRLDLINEPQEDPILGVFIQQALSSKSWYKKDAYKVEDMFGEAINKVVEEGLTPLKAIDEAAEEINEE